MTHKLVECYRCEGTGHMHPEDAESGRDWMGRKPNTYFGCTVCNGSGWVEKEEDDE